MKKLLFIILLLIPRICFGQADDYYVTTTGAGGKDGLAWASAFGKDEFEADAEGNAEAGDRYFVAGGTYDYTDNDFLCANDGTATSVIWVIGVDTGTSAEPPTFSDWATGTNRPLFQMATRALAFDNYWHITNLRITTTHSSGLNVDDGGIVENCFSFNSSGSANRAIDIGGGVTVAAHAINSEAVSTNGSGIYVQVGATVEGCYIHDSTMGIETVGNSNSYIGNIIDTCTTGISLVSFDKITIALNTIYDCTTGIAATDGLAHTIIGNIIDTCTTGASWTTEQEINYFDYNAWGNNTADTSNVTKGNHAQTSASTYLASAGSEDFTLASGSDCLDAGMQFTDIVTQGTLVGDYKWNIGADQDDVVAAVIGHPQLIMITKDVYYDRINKKFVYLNNILDSLYD